MQIHAKVIDQTKRDGSFQWQIPSGWHAVASADSLVLDSVDNYDSKMIYVTYTSRDHSVISTDSLAVHFGEDGWEPTAKPAQPAGQSTIATIEKKKNDLIVAPNPANQKVRITISGFVEKADIEIYNLTGRLIKSEIVKQPSSFLDVSNFSDGLYIIKATTGNNTYTQKLSIVH